MEYANVATHRSNFVRQVTVNGQNVFLRQIWSLQ